MAVGWNNSSKLERRVAMIVFLVLFIELILGLDLYMVRDFVTPSLVKISNLNIQKNLTLHF